MPVKSAHKRRRRQGSRYARRVGDVRLLRSCRQDSRQRLSLEDVATLFVTASGRDSVGWIAAAAARHRQAGA